MTEVKLIPQEGYNFLWIDGYLWMWDIPNEQKAQQKLSQQAHGDVLIAGYGLGIVQRYLMENPAVTSVTTIEVLPEVIDIVSKAYGQLHGEVIIADFFEFETDKKYDFVIGDVWEDIEEEALRKYNQFTNQAQKYLKPTGRILAWGQGFFDYLNSKK